MAESAVDIRKTDCQLESPKDVGAFFASDAWQRKLELAREARAKVLATRAATAPRAKRGPKRPRTPTIVVPRPQHHAIPAEELEVPPARWGAVAVALSSGLGLVAAIMLWMGLGTDGPGDIGEQIALDGGTALERPAEAAPARDTSPVLRPSDRGEVAAGPAGERRLRFSGPVGTDSTGPAASIRLRLPPGTPNFALDTMTVAQAATLSPSAPETGEAQIALATAPGAAPAADAEPGASAGTVRPLLADRRLTLVASAPQPELLSDLKSAGADDVALRTTPFKAQETSVHYFRAADAETAELLAGMLNGSALDLIGFRPAPPPGTVEIHLAAE